MVVMLFTVVLDLLRELQVHVVEVDAGGVLVVVDRWDGQGRDWERMGHTLGNLHKLVFENFL